MGGGRGVMMVAIVGALVAAGCLTPSNAVQPSRMLEGTTNFVLHAPTLDPGTTWTYTSAAGNVTLRVLAAAEGGVLMLRDPSVPAMKGTTPLPPSGLAVLHVDHDLTARPLGLRNETACMDADPAACKVLGDPLERPLKYPVPFPLRYGPLPERSLGNFDGGSLFGTTRITTGGEVGRLRPEDVPGLGILDVVRVSVYFRETCEGGLACIFNGLDGTTTKWHRFDYAPALGTLVRHVVEDGSDSCAAGPWIWCSGFALKRVERDNRAWTEEEIALLLLPEGHIDGVEARRHAASVAAKRAAQEASRGRIDITQGTARLAWDGLPRQGETAWSIHDTDGGQVASGTGPSIPLPAVPGAYGIRAETRVDGARRIVWEQAATEPSVENGTMGCLVECAGTVTMDVHDEAATLEITAPAYGILTIEGLGGATRDVPGRRDPSTGKWYHQGTLQPGDSTWSWSPGRLSLPLDTTWDLEWELVRSFHGFHPWAVFGADWPLGPSGPDEVAVHVRPTMDAPSTVRFRISAASGGFQASLPADTSWSVLHHGEAMVNGSGDAGSFVVDHAGTYVVLVRASAPDGNTLTAAAEVVVTASDIAPIAHLAPDVTPATVDVDRPFSRLTVDASVHMASGATSSVNGVVHLLDGDGLIVDTASRSVENGTETWHLEVQRDACFGRIPKCAYGTWTAVWSPTEWYLPVEGSIRVQVWP